MRKKNPFVIALSAIILFSLMLLIVFFPKMKEAYKESGVQTLLLNHQENINEREVAVCFITENSVWALFDTTIAKKGSDRLHDAVEALLNGPTRQAKDLGYNTYIPDGTSLIGLCASRETLFVSLSREFLSTTDLNKAKEQILHTSQQINSAIEKVTVLVDQKPVEL